jgi:hypothetical protein
MSAHPYLSLPVFVITRICHCPYLSLPLFVIASSTPARGRPALDETVLALTIFG